MGELKLAKLPDRTPVKFTITVNPELAQALREYRDCYEATYGAAEDVSELIPFMLAAFIESDSRFKKALRDRQGSVAGSGHKQTLLVRDRSSVQPTASTAGPSN